MIEIENGIPIPPSRFGAGRRSEISLALEALDVGQSILVPAKKSAGGLVSNAERLLPGRIFVSRSVDGGARIWRTK